MNTTEPGSDRKGGLFATTHWTVVLEAAKTQGPDAQQALEALCGNYRRPLYCFALRKGLTHEDAEDVTQQFLADRVATRFVLKGLDPVRGRFRTWLLNSFQNFLCNQWAKQRAQKRGGGSLHVSLDATEPDGLPSTEPSCEPTPELFYDRAWAWTVLERGLARLQERYQANGEAALYDQLVQYLPGAGTPPKQSELAAKLGITEGALKMRVSRLKKELGRLVRAELARTVAAESEVEAEFQYLLSVLSSNDRHGL